MNNLYRKLLLIVSTCIFIFQGFSQNINPDFNQVFLPGEVSVIDLYMDESEKQQLLFPADLFADTYYKAEFNFYNSLIDTTIENVGIRIRGNTARYSTKKSFKIDFKEFGGEQFFKLKKLNLKPNNNDPSQLREYLTQLMYRKINIPVARGSYTEVYINDEYMGLYLNVENIDDEFVDRRFGNEDGNLYKCLWGATLETSNDIFNSKQYELKTNEEINNRSKLENLIQIINKKDDGNWSNEIQSVFEVDLYIRQLAVEAMTGHWDGYSYNINNFYLYENSETGKTVFIPYDMDNTWGIDWVGQDWGKRDLLKWSSDNFRTPLTTRILAIPEFREKYIQYLYDVLFYFQDRMYIDSVAYSVYDLIYNSIDNDSYYPLAYGYDIDNFWDSYEVAAGGHVKYSISEYIETRRLYAQNQLPEIVEAKLINDFTFNVWPNPSNGEMLYVTGKNCDTSSIKIYDVWSKSISFYLDDNNVLRFQQQLPSGIYFLLAGNETRKFVVTNFK